ncbi:aquaporin-like [Plodia interpunctella]|uniref:aquaporin-like n=1 Tax=Plodia interpunctella TaxID=58824 RepID=UPI002368F22C|nr:aquaporin-like [Plodia interpunctella]
MTLPPNTRSIVVCVSDSKPAKPQSLFKTIATWYCSQWKAIVAEFVAMVFLMSFGCMSGIPLEGFDVLPPLQGPLGFGLTVMMNIQIFGHLSGAYMNPFVAIIACIFGKISIVLTIIYIIIECLGSIVGYAIVMSVSSYDMVENEVCLTLPHARINEYQTLGVEIILSAALSLLNCALWDPQYAARQDSAAIKFGLSIIVLSIAGGHLTGASMNPARTLGPAFWNGRWDAHWVYWVGPMVGGILPAIFYKYVWLKISEIETVENEQSANEVKDK